jgi:hypothetical protein
LRFTVIYSQAKTLKSEKFSLRFAFVLLVVQL